MQSPWLPHPGCRRSVNTHYAGLPGAARRAGDLIAPQSHPGTLLWFLIALFLGIVQVHEYYVQGFPTGPRYCRLQKSFPRGLDARVLQCLPAPDASVREQKRCFRCEDLSLPSWTATETHAPPPPECTSVPSHWASDAGTDVEWEFHVEPHLYRPSTPISAPTCPALQHTGGPAHTAPPQFRACGIAFIPCCSSPHPTSSPPPNPEHPLAGITCLPMGGPTEGT